jgi:hypothetical protein
MPTYRLTCVACPFAETVDGDIRAVFDRVEDHRAVTEAREGGRDHFVEFEVVEW